MAQKVTWLPLDGLRPSPKNFFRPPGEEELNELAASIAQRSVVHPSVTGRATPTTR